ncbi:GNAT family N-acetyltransferase [Streptomyces pilosus]|uniref:GNAT family N-acetyltransferase n=1 Tax=Streptomyces pilosus TaxID=28893 RepID=UPI0016785846|nr:GNAT family N-acetyltransferase [Streptomyces pilosus]GGV58114.1 aminoglycoside 2'-N-acetyltransferase [Streptomyces pilosus]
MTTAADVRTAHTSQLAPLELTAVRSLLYDAFDGDFGAEDWDHTLGGVHALVRDGRGLAAHGAVVMRRVRYGRRWLRTGYVEGVAVRADVRRQGLGGAVMAALEGVVTRAYDLGALSASDEGAALYAARGWRAWEGRIGALGPDGVVRLPDEEGSTYVWPVPADLTGELVFDWRDGDVL